MKESNSFKIHHSPVLCIHFVLNSKVVGWCGMDDRVDKKMIPHSTVTHETAIDSGPSARVAAYCQRRCKGLVVEIRLLVFIVLQ